VYVREPVRSETARTCLEQNLDYARKLGAQLEILSAPDAAEAILSFAMQRGITQIFVGHSSVSHSIWGRVRGGLVTRLIRSAEGIDVVVYPH
jgi:K+-sensing histidine kinase KdpD